MAACARLPIKLELDKPDNSQLTPEDRGKCGGKIMMGERETGMEEKSTQKWETSIFNAFFFFFNMKPGQRGAFSSVTFVLLDSLQIERNTHLARCVNAEILCVFFHNTAQAHRF